MTALADTGKTAPHWPFQHHPSATNICLIPDGHGGLATCLTVSIRGIQFDVRPAIDGGADVFDHGGSMEVCPSEVADAAGGYDDWAEPDAADVDACYQALLNLWADANEQASELCTGTIGRSATLMLRSLNGNLAA